MALKGQLGTCFALSASILLSIGCGAGFLILQNSCMSKSSQALVIGKYCSGVSSSRVDSIASTIIQVLTTLIIFSLGAAVCAFRTKCLEKGIPEGVYVALGGQAWKYQMVAMLTKWWGVVGLVVVLTYGPLSVQPLLNFSQSPQVIYNWIAPSRPGADNFTIETALSNLPGKHHSTYNELTSDFVAERIASDLENSQSKDLLAQVGLQELYASSAVSMGALGKNNSAVTGVVRNSVFQGETPLSFANNTATTSQQVFEFRDTFATIASSCFSDVPSGGFTPEETFLQQFPNNYQNISNVSSYSGLEARIKGIYRAGSLKKVDLFGIEVGEMTFTPQTVRVSVAAVITEDNSPNSRIVNCQSSIEVGEGHALVNPRTRNLTMLYSSKMPTIDQMTFKHSVETLFLGSNGMTTNTNGVLKDTISNWLHARLCSAVSLALEYMQFSNSYLDTRKVTGSYVNATDHMDSYHDDPDYYTLEFRTNYPLFTPYIVTYIPRKAAWLFVCILVGFNTALCVIALVFASLANTNVKGSAENALFDNLAAKDVALRTGDCFGVGNPAAMLNLGKDASNDEDVQRKQAFKTNLYVMKNCQGNRNAVRIGFGNNAMVVP